MAENNTANAKANNIANNTANAKANNTANAKANNNAKNQPNSPQQISNNKPKKNSNVGTASNKKSQETVEADTSEYDLGNIVKDVFLSSSTTRIILSSMIVIIFFLVSIALLYHYSTGRRVQTLYNKTLPLFNDTSFLIDSSNMNPSFNLKQTYIIYINFDNSAGNDIWYNSFHENKIILRRLDDNFMVKYNPATNKLVVNIRIQKLDIQQTDSNIDGSLASTSESEFGLHNSYEYIYLDNIPHHQWLQIAIILDNRLVDIYVNSKLAVSRVIDNVPIISNETLMLGQEYHNPNAYLGRLEYTNDILSTLDLKSLYFKNMRFLKVDPILRDTVRMDSYEVRQKLNPSPS